MNGASSVSLYIHFAHFVVDNIVHTNDCPLPPIKAQAEQARSTHQAGCWVATASIEGYEGNLLPQEWGVSSHLRMLEGEYHSFRISRLWSSACLRGVAIFSFYSRAFKGIHHLNRSGRFPLLFVFRFKFLVALTRYFS